MTFNREECGEVLLKLEVKEEPKDNFESEAWVEDIIKQDECVQGPELETFCDPTNDSDEALCELKEESMEYSKSDEARVEDMIKQKMFMIPIENNFTKQEVYEVDDDDIPDDFD